MKIYQKPISKLLIRIKISDKNSTEKIVLCDTTLIVVADMIEKIISYNEIYELESNQDVLVTIRECTGSKHGNSKSLRSNRIPVSDIYRYILNEVTINN